MGLMHPAFTTVGKSKKKQKFKSAEAKRESERLSAEWEALKARHETKPVQKPFKQKTYSPKIPAGRTTNRHIPSLSDGIGVAAAKETMMYTGDKMIGIAQMSKSNAVPVFRKDHIVEIGQMRRS